MNKFKNKYRIPSARLKYWDYGSSGLYFITICTRDRVCYFGDVVTNTIETPPPVETQNVASHEITTNTPKPVETQNIAIHNKNIIPQPPIETQNIASLQQPTIPQSSVQTQNIASLQTTEIGEIAIKNWLEIPMHFPFVELDEFIVMPNHIHGILFFNKPENQEWNPNSFGPQSQNLASVIRGYKTSVASYAQKNNIEFKWQPRYHDHIIRTEKDLNRIRQYIIDNAANWIQDKNNIENLLM